MKNIKLAIICLSIASFAGIDASWSAFTSQCRKDDLIARCEKRDEHEKIYKISKLKITDTEYQNELEETKNELLDLLPLFSGNMSNDQFKAIEKMNKKISALASVYLKPVKNKNKNKKNNQK